jgi:hypothetical protein
MKSWAAVTCTLGALALFGCSPTGSAAARASLDCPASQGELTRTSKAPDGRACAYADRAGDEVSLRLVSVTSSPEAALAPIEQELQALAPADAAAAKGSPDESSERADVALPGLHVRAEGDKAEVSLGSLHVDAGSGGAVVRQARAVRLQGQPFALERRGYRATFVIAREDLPGGLTSVGYEAGGPRDGPLAVAVVRMKGRDDDAIQHDVRRLVRRNGGV